jgi:hypothetical protein
VTPTQLIEKLSKQAEEITAAIDKRQASLGVSIASAERELFSRLLEEITSELTFKNGVIENSVSNYLVLIRLDRAFDSWVNEVMNPVTKEFVKDLFSVAEMTGAYYEGYAAEKLINDIATSNELLRAALGIDSKGNLIKGSIMADISSVSTVRTEIKQIALLGINSGQTLKEFSKSIRDYVKGVEKDGGAVNKFFKSRQSGYAYDLLNKVAEIKNEEFREQLDLKYFIYVGDIIQDSRAFCIKKAGKVFAVVEADREWSGDPDLIGKGTGIPYTPRIDRGRWNCRHRIRYISNELAKQIDPKKVQQIEQSYGVINVE